VARVAEADESGSSPTFDEFDESFYDISCAVGGCATTLEVSLNATSETLLVGCSDGQVFKRWLMEFLLELASAMGALRSIMTSAAFLITDFWLYTSAEAQSLKKN
jgi:hypothetical protein